MAVDVPALGTRRLTLTYPAVQGSWRGVLPRDGTRQARRPRRRRPARQHTARGAHRPPDASGVHILRPGGLTGYKSRPMTVLAGDIGGTNCSARDLRRAGLRPARREADLRADVPLGVVRVAGRHRRAVRGGGRGRRSARAPRSRRACLGIAGPIENNICRATNLPWVVDGTALSQRLGIARVLLVNDFTPPRWVSPPSAPTSWSRWAATCASRTVRWRCWAPARVWGRLFCSGRPSRTATRSSRRREATSTWPRARRWNTAWSTS